MNTEEATPTRFYPSLLQAIGITILIMLALLVLGRAYPFLSYYFRPSICIMIIYLCAMGAVGYLTAIRLRKASGNTEPIPFQVTSPKLIILVILSFLALIFGVLYPISALIPLDEQSIEILRFNLSYADFFTFFTVVVLAPIFEELIFRGIILDGFLKKYSPVLAIVLSSFLFAIIHINLPQVTTAFIGGLLLGWIYYRFKNILLCILGHATINLTSFSILKIYGFEKVISDSKAFFFSTAGITAMLIGVIAFIFLIYLLHKKVR